MFISHQPASCSVPDSVSALLIYKSALLHTKDFSKATVTRGNVLAHSSCSLKTNKWLLEYQLEGSQTPAFLFMPFKKFLQHNVHYKI